jgi:hypothetical protein
MTDKDIVTRLRGFLLPNDTLSIIRDEAADEIERLREELEDAKIQLANMEDDYYRIRDHNER